MKKWLIITLIAAIVLAVAAISFFLYGNKKQAILSKVPANAKSVIIINLPSLLTKLVIDDLGSDTKRAAKLAEMMPDSLPKIDFNKSGISFLEKIVLFTTENTDNDQVTLNLILRIANYKEFNNFIDSLVANKMLDVLKHETENTAWSKQYRTIISWNKHFVTASRLTNNQVQNEKNLQATLLLEKEKSIMTDSIFMQKQTTDFDVLLYSIPYTNYPKKGREFIQSNIKSLISLIRFKDGELELETELSPKKASLLEKLFNVPEKELAQLNISDSFAINTIFNINSQVFFQIMEQYSSIKFNRNKAPYFAAWDGRANISINGTKNIENEYISYDYDDDFNKIEVKKIVKDKVWDIQAIFGTNKPILDSIFAKTKVYKSKKDSLLFKGSNFVVKNLGTTNLCYNKHVNRPDLLKKTKIANISVELNYQSFIPLLNNFKITKDSLLFNKLKFEKLKLNINKKEQISILCNFYFADKQKNSFFSITEQLE